MLTTTKDKDDKEIKEDDLVKAYDEENKMPIEFGEI